MDWLHPTFVWALAAVPIAAWLFWRARRERRAAFRQFGDVGLVRGLASAARPGRRTLKAILVIVAIGAMALALMGPRLGTKVRTVERTGVDVIVALDVSTSMRAEDVAPSRLARAKKEIRDLTNRLRGDRIGLVLFAGTGFVQCPLTTDYGALHLFLDVAGPDRVPVQGTNFDAALDAAIEAFDAARPPSDSTTRPEDRRSRVLLVLSDGENHVGSLDDVKQRARDHDVTLFTAGIGTAEGARIPIYENEKRVGVKRDERGRTVRTRLQESALMTLAEEGAYFRIGSTSSALSDVPTALRQLDTTTLATETFSEYAEMFQWPLAVALGLLLVDVWVPGRSRGRRPGWGGAQEGGGIE